MARISISLVYLRVAYFYIALSCALKIGTVETVSVEFIIINVYNYVSVIIVDPGTTWFELHRSTYSQIFFFSQYAVGPPRIPGFRNYKLNQLRIKAVLKTAF